MKNANAPVVGMDVGGTKIYVGVIDKAGKILATARKKTKAELGFEGSSRRMIACINEAISKANLTIDDIGAIGVGTPGPLDMDKGEIIFTPNLKWKNAPVRDVLANAFNKPVKVDNDVNVGVLGEYVYGLKKTAKDIIGLFVGTGIGGGIIIDGHLLHGYNQNAGELGHMSVNANGQKCGCGNVGCLEAYSSKVAIERMIREEIKKGKKTQIAKKLAETNRIGSGALAKAYFAGDKVVQKAIRTSAKYMGVAVTSFLHIFNPEVIILGGGVVEAFGDEYVDIVKKVVKKRAIPFTQRNIKIIPAILGDDSGIYGASVLARELIKQDTNNG